MRDKITLFLSLLDIWVVAIIIICGMHMQLEKEKFSILARHKVRELLYLAN